MKILSILLIIGSLSKIGYLFGDEELIDEMKSSEDFQNLPFSPETLARLITGLLIFESLIGLFCGIFILIG
jgi:hypothetical protein